MISVEVHALDADADEAAAIQALKDATGMDDHHASQPFGLLYWHKRPFSVRLTSEEAAARFIERLRACGYHGRLAGSDRAHA